MSGSAPVAVIVPVLGDTAPLRSLLGQLCEQAPPAAAIVVVSGRRDRELGELCRRHGCTYLETAASRGAQLDAGAAAATAEILWFVHADAELPAGAVGAVAAAIAAGADSGCFRFAFQGRPAWHKALLARLVALRIAFGGIPYGDQGIFVRRERYRACGGFAPQPLFEEVTLVKRLRASGRFVVLDLPLKVATRRWERDGWWRRSLHNRWLALRYAFGAPPERLARAYRGLLRANAETER